MDEPASERFPSGEVTGPEGTPLVLIVEDDALLRSFWARRLSADYRIVVTGTAEEAADLNELHGDHELDDIPVIVLTGGNDEERRTWRAEGQAPTPVERSADSFSA